MFFYCAFWVVHDFPRTVRKNVFFLGWSTTSVGLCEKTDFFRVQKMTFFRVRKNGAFWLQRKAAGFAP